MLGYLDDTCNSPLARFVHTCQSQPCEYPEYTQTSLFARLACTNYVIDRHVCLLLLTESKDSDRVSDLLHGATIKP